MVTTYIGNYNLEHNNQLPVISASLETNILKGKSKIKNFYKNLTNKLRKNVEKLGRKNVEKNERKIVVERVNKVDDGFEKNAKSYLDIVKNKLTKLTNSINNFIEINANTVKFKQNLVKLYLFIKIKNKMSKDENRDEKSLSIFKSIQDDLKTDSSNIFNLRTYYQEIQTFQERINSKIKFIKITTNLLK